jgi:hypothetical protein
MWLTVVIVGLSLAVMTLAVLTVHRARLDRRRSEARVAALAAAMDNPPWEEVLIDDAERPTVTPVSSTMSLVAPDVERPSRIPAFAVAALVIVGAGTLLFVGMNGGSRPTRLPVPASAEDAAIELVSMRHVLDGETLIVSGLVRNPAPSATPGLSAVVSVLGRDGRVIARGESQLDPLVLEPGKETTFRVSVSDVGDPGRYRVAFVNGSQIVPHVDRRSDLARTALANDARGN